MGRITPHPQSPECAGQSRIDYLSPAEQVSMGDWWFDIATPEHFWIQRRFRVMQRLADSAIKSAKVAAEIGCGNGLLQSQIESFYRIPVVGFELNEVALAKNMSRISPLYCYNIHDRRPEFRKHFDLLLLFDVLEHIENESGFLQSVRFHLAEGGKLLINVPAHQQLYSDYDRAAGHLRRYSLNQLADVCDRNELRVLTSTYWGLPLLPLLLLRKGMSLRKDGKAGFDPKTQAINRFLSIIGRCEPTPQSFLGTSVMMVVENRLGEA
jgi:SAM-dependent methyltransferase